MVDFRLKPGTFDRFHKLIVENARASVRDEPGCRQFDVVTPNGAADRVVLYEIYDDPAAFETHKRTPHFAVFDRESASLVDSKAVTLGRLDYAGTDG
ncbi:MAG TPA: putative quinol monooxygenase [Hyphomonadaceae bacterium]|jgi:quinol monooxygenase YgiN